jgi:hypothetical protein
MQPGSPIFPHDRRAKWSILIVMNWGLGVVLAGAMTGLVPSSARAHDGDGRHHVFPERNDDATTRASMWQSLDGWRRSPLESPPDGGSRVAAIFTVREPRTVTLQARGLQADADGHCSEGAGAGPWTSMEETFTLEEVRIAVLDLGDRFACAQLRMRGADDELVEELQWELLEPQYPEAGRRSREMIAAGHRPVTSIGPELLRIGVITREEWEARPTQCTAIEDGWYRMAIHHTAGPTTAGGTVEGRLKATQAYAMDSGTWCDIPYQMMVGYDGSLWEGRGLVLRSGATGGGNNDGNLAVCFIGCFHTPDSACVGGQGHPVTDAMMHHGRLMVQTLVRLFDIPSNSESIRGHQDWPGNSTACPGSLLHPRLGELRADLAWFSGEETGRSWGEEPIEVEVGSAHELWIELENTGGLPWQPGETFLAPTEPRDADSPLHDASWPTPIRAATLTETVAPGEVGRFVFRVAPDASESIVQAFGLVDEGVTWFADAPWGGGPADDLAVVSIVGAGEGPGADDGGGDGGEPGEPGDPAEPNPSDPGVDDPEGGLPHGSLPPGYGEEAPEGCMCAVPPSPTMLGAGWLLLLFARRRRVDPVA